MYTLTSINDKKKINKKYTLTCINDKKRSIKNIYWPVLVFKKNIYWPLLMIKNGQ